SMVLKAVAVVDAKTEQVKLFPWHDLESDGEDIQADSPEDGSTLESSQFSDCKILSSKNADGKLVMTIECE
ncbi:MAG: hypothetical protein KAS11_04525, partial [Candidatus Aenigmarchaeota archaeon]|nr:hypothetical protein [Candidatus Aenigmarchaeota archaeon]